MRFFDAKHIILLSLVFMTMFCLTSNAQKLAYKEIADFFYNNDTISNDELRDELMSLYETLFINDNKERLEYLSKENYYKELLLKRNSTLLYFSIASLFFIIVFGYTSFIIYKTKEENKMKAFEEEIIVAINEKEKKYADIVNLLPQIVFETNKTGYFTFVNEYYKLKTNFSDNEIYLSSLSNVIFYRSSKKQILATTEEEFKELNGKEFFLKRKDNSFIPVILYISPVYFGQNYFGTRGMILDVSDSKEVEERLLRTIITTEEEERMRFSKDLHDTLGPLLSTLKLYINEFYSEKYSDEEKHNLVKEINNMVNDAISYTREISYNLTPLTLKDYGIAKSLNLFIQKINSLNKVEIIFKQKNEEKRYDIFFEINVYRIVLELIQNSIKHSDASNIVIDISENENVFKLIYFDNGKGFNIEKALSNNTGMGLLNITSRIKSIKGHYEIKSEKGEGFSFILSCHLND